MTTNYTITHNETYDSHEVTFDSKPARAILDAMKALGMRWNHKKGCWYGFATERQLIDAIIENGTGETVTGEESTPTVYTDGYLGGGASYGSKSNQHLYGSDLSKAIREDLKNAGIKGVTVKCKTYSGGQSLSLTVTFQPEDMANPYEYLDNYRISAGCAWIYTGEDTCPVHIDKYFEATAEEQHAIRFSAAKYDYIKTATTIQMMNHYHTDKYTEFSPSFMEKIQKILSIVQAYHYDESNSMVDYFDTNFYYDLYTKPANPAEPFFPGELEDLYAPLF